MSKFYRAVLTAMAFVVLTTAAHAGKSGKKVSFPNVAPAWALAHAIQTEAHDKRRGEEAVMYAVLQRSDTGWYGTKGNIISTVYWPKQFSGPRKWKPWKSDDHMERQRWERTLPYAEKSLALWKKGVVPVSKEIREKLKGCMNFDLVERTDLGEPCGEVDGNHFYRP